MQESSLMTGSMGHASSDETKESLQNLETTLNADVSSNAKDLTGSNTYLEGLSTPRIDVNGLNHLELPEGTGHNNVIPSEFDLDDHKPSAIKTNSMPNAGPSIPQILHLICNGNDGSPTTKQSALQQLIETSVAGDHSIWTKILTAVLEVLDEADSSVWEVALSLITEMLKNQKNAMEDSVEIIIEKLLHVAKDVVPKVSNEAEHCLTVVLSQYDPFRCLTVIIPLLVTEDEKTLITCINCLTKLVGRLSEEELLGQLPSFIPALYEAFGNQSADILKTVVFCLVDIYIMLGKAFLPYLERLNSTQLRLVTIYANRISQARTGTTIDASQ